MATQVSIDENLLDEAFLVSGLNNKKDTIELALTEFIQRKRQHEIISLFGRLPQDADYNYKKLR